MRAEDFGIDIKTGYHRKNPLTAAESRYLDLLWGDHEGAGHKISATDLAEKWGPTVVSFEQAKRAVRHMQNHLLCDHNIPVLSKAGDGGGYWIAETEAEAEEFYGSFRQRGLTGLVKASRGKQSAMVDMVTQLSFEFEDLVDKTGEYTQHIKPAGPMPAPIEVVDRFLYKMTRDPQKFADGLRKIGEKYGGVLLPREKVIEIKERVRQVQVLVGELGI